MECKGRIGQIVRIKSSDGNSAIDLDEHFFGFHRRLREFYEAAINYPETVRREGER